MSRCLPRHHLVRKVTPHMGYTGPLSLQPRALPQPMLFPLGQHARAAQCATELAAGCNVSVQVHQECFGGGQLFTHPTPVGGTVEGSHVFGRHSRSNVGSQPLNLGSST